MFELSNNQRIYFGLEPIDSSWQKVILKGDQYRPKSILYYDKETIKRQIVSTDSEYIERQYDEQTRNREILIPKTVKGKEKKITSSVLESRQPLGNYCRIDGKGRIYIGSYITRTTFYDSQWTKVPASVDSNISTYVDQFISSVPADYFDQLASFCQAKRKNVKFKNGDFFCFRLNLTEYAFGRVLLDIHTLRKYYKITKDHGLGFLMGRPVMIALYPFISTLKNVDIGMLENMKTLPSDYIFDNLLFYGEFEIIGNKKLSEKDLDFPMSYGGHISSTKDCVFFQWGLIHGEIPIKHFNKYLTEINPLLPANHPNRAVDNPYGHYGLGFYPTLNQSDIRKTIQNEGQFNFDSSSHYSTIFDLRNPKNKEIKNEIMTAFRLQPNKSYEENRLMTGTKSIEDFLKKS